MDDYLRKTLAFILAGGQGERLYPLTRDRSKPAVPFGGIYRIVDFPLSNCLNSALQKVIVLTQYKSLSLDRHVKTAWNMFQRDLGGFIDVVPPQQRITADWYRGTADAIFQNIYIIEMEKPEYVLILSGDHVYKMDYRKMLRHHIETDADLTIAAIETPVGEASRFGVLEVDRSNRVVGFEEKPKNPKTIPGKEGSSFISMGIYAFKTGKLVKYLSDDHKLEGSNDFGKDIIPRIYPTDRVFTYDYVAAEGERAYWKDIGTIQSFFESNMDLASVTPQLNLYDRGWLIRTFMEQWPPGKMILDEGERRGVALNSIISNGAIVSGGRVSGSIISPGVKVNSYADIQNSIIFHRVNVGRRTRIKNAIIDKYVNIPEGEEIGYDLEKDSSRFTVTEEGIVVVPKGFQFE
ncbi:MAG: glucose-1-phosphate adenylyltransferase [Spirochaetes bacterium]|nr:glucose-1-phosphate adenylyltransferase [Spirochaetota bacterium]HPA73799.1 glucose-1-phosphate adenylyltransferase [Spirochaetota bacterium]